MTPLSLALVATGLAVLAVGAAVPGRPEDRLVRRTRPNGAAPAIRAARAIGAARAGSAPTAAASRALPGPGSAPAGRGARESPRRLATLTAGSLLGAVAGALLGGPLPVVFLAAMAAGGVATTLRSRRLALVRQERRAAAHEVLTAMVGELRAGRSREEALVAAARAVATTTGDLSAALAVVARREDIPAGLRTLAGRELESLRRLAACWQVAAQTGAELAPVLDRVSQGLRADEVVRRHATASLAGPRSTATLLAALPLATLALGQTIGARPLEVLSTPLGLLCLGTGLPLLAVGVAWTRWIAWRAEQVATDA